MNTIKLRVVKAIVNDIDSLIVMSLDPEGRKACMTIAEFDGDGQAEFIINSNGIVSREEVGYKDSVAEFEKEWEQAYTYLPSLTFLLGN